MFEEFTGVTESPRSNLLFVSLSMISTLEVIELKPFVRSCYWVKQVY